MEEERWIGANELIQSIRDNGLLGSAYTDRQREDDLVAKIERRAKWSHIADKLYGIIDLVDKYQISFEISYNAYSEIVDAIYDILGERYEYK